MCDRALYQSDWFYQGIFSQPDRRSGSSGRTDLLISVRRFFRISIRLTISFGLAWIIALFLELAIFSDTITEKLKSDYLTANEPIFERIGQYEAELDRQIGERRGNLTALEALYRSERTSANTSDPATTAQSERYEQLMRETNEHKRVGCAGTRLAHRAAPDRRKDHKLLGGHECRGTGPAHQSDQQRTIARSFRDAGREPLCSELS
jgi:hypothetical protein